MFLHCLRHSDFFRDFFVFFVVELSESMRLTFARSRDCFRCSYFFVFFVSFVVGFFKGLRPNFAPATING
jgi:hypothetical protein